MNRALVVASHALRESLRRRVFVVVLLLSALFLGLYTWGAAELFDDVDAFQGHEFGVEVETAEGLKTFDGAGRDDAPRIVNDLVAAGEQVFEVRLLRSTLEDVYVEAVT